MKRITIIGCGGSGKSALARQLGAILGLPVIHLDSLYWKSGWVSTPRPEWTRIQKELVRGDSWIIDGNYGGTLDIRLAACSAVIFLDFPSRICLWRVIKRALFSGEESRPDMAPGCSERLLSRDFFDFLKWIWSYPSEFRPLILEKLEKYSMGRQMIILRHPREVEGFLGGLKQRTASHTVADEPKGEEWLSDGGPHAA